MVYECERFQVSTLLPARVHRCTTCKSTEVTITGPICYHRYGRARYLVPHLLEAQFLLFLNSQLKLNAAVCWMFQIRRTNSPRGSAVMYWAGNSRAFPLPAILDCPAKMKISMAMQPWTASLEPWLEGGADGHYDCPSSFVSRRSALGFCNDVIMPHFLCL